MNENPVYKIGQWVAIIHNDYGSAADPIGQITSTSSSYSHNNTSGVHVKTAAYKFPLYHFLSQIQPIELSELEKVVYVIAD